MAENFTKYFTLDEARKALPQVVSKLESIQSYRAELSKLAAEMEGMGVVAEDGKPARERLQERLTQVTQLVDEVTGSGILVRNLETGLIDFPSRRDGDDIFLCYQLGEDDIHYWHHINDGYPGRKSL